MPTAREVLREIIDQAGSHLVSVTFIKKDGSRRQLTFNPHDHADVKGTGAPCTNPDIFKIRDIKLGAWRSFDATRVVKITSEGSTLEF